MVHSEVNNHYHWHRVRLKEGLAKRRNWILMGMQSMKRNIKQSLVCGRTRILWRKHRHKAIQAMCQLWKQLFHCVIDVIFWGRNDQTSATVCHEHTMSKTDKHTGVFPQCQNLLTNNKFTRFSFGEGWDRNLTNRLTFLDSSGWGKQFLFLFES